MFRSPRTLPAKRMCQIVTQCSIISIISITHNNDDKPHEAKPRSKVPEITGAWKVYSPAECVESGFVVTTNQHDNNP